MYKQKYIKHDVMYNAESILFNSLYFLKLSLTN